MPSIQTPHAWQLAAVSRMGRVTSFALVALSVDALIARSPFATSWIVAALVAPPLIVAIRVVRGFPHALGAATATFLAAAAIGLASSVRSLMPVAILGTVAALLAMPRKAPVPAIELSRTNRDGPEPVTVWR